MNLYKCPWECGYYSDDADEIDDHVIIAHNRDPFERMDG